ncbi:MAG: hypothetical protein AVO33_09550 [delta proteobacterium ML8_F1]|nr:MAG: hypothetical protein AVO33_09550 [delta proteobacterium ML8_F1]
MNRLKGIAAVMFSAIIYGSVPFFAKSIYSLGGNPITLTFMRGLFSLPLLYFLARKFNVGTMKITLEELRKLLILVLGGYAITAILLYASYVFIPTGIATTLHFSYPIFVVLGFMVFYGEKPTPAVTAALVLSFVGMLFFNDTDARINLPGFVMALGSGVTYGFFIIYVKKSGLNQMNLIKLTFYLALGATVTFLFFGLLTRSLTLHIQPMGWLLTVLAANLVALGGVYLFQLGIRIVGPQRTAILSTFEPITSILIGTLVFEEVLNLRIFSGILLILSSVVIIALDENRHLKKSLPPKNL